MLSFQSNIYFSSHQFINQLQKIIPKIFFPIRIKSEYVEISECISVKKNKVFIFEKKVQN